MFTNKLSVLSLLVTIGICFSNCTDPAQTKEENKVEKGADPFERYDKTSTMMSLAWLANINSGMYATPDSLKTHAEESVQKILADTTVINEIGSWEMIWGPVVFTHQIPFGKGKHRTDNTIMLLKGKEPDDSTKDLYVIAIAGTNFASVYDWVQEDLKVTTMVRWPEGNDYFDKFESPDTSKNSSITNTGAYISDATNTGLNNLFNKMADSAGNTLVTVLKKFNKQSGPVELAVTGHSLGGALAPCVALALKENQTVWNAPENVTVTTYPFAGPTPGNSHFKKHFFTVIGQENFHGYYNRYDVVPRGFNENAMDSIPGLYDDIDPTLQKQCVIQKLTTCVKDNTSKFDYTSLYDSSDQFSYKVDYSDAVYDKALTSHPRGTCITLDLLNCGEYNCDTLYARTVNFGAMAAIQHIKAYTEHFGIQRVSDVITKYIEHGRNPSKLTLSELLKAQAFKGCLISKNEE